MFNNNNFKIKTTIILSLLMVIILVKPSQIKADAMTSIVEETTYFEEDGELIGVVGDVEIEDLGEIDTYKKPNEKQTFFTGYSVKEQESSIGNPVEILLENETYDFAKKPRFGNLAKKHGDPTVLVFPTSSGGSRTTYITNDESSGVFPILDAKDDRYKIAISGTIGWIDKKFVSSITSFANTKSYNYYHVDSNGDLIHRVSRNQTATAYYTGFVQGKAPNYLSKNITTKYLSFDGQYFYPATSEGMKNLVTDYNSSTRKLSINSKTPYINYFQWLPFRTQSNLTNQDFKNYLKDNKHTSQLSSRLVGTEKLFYDLGNFHGHNPALGFVTAVHESGFGGSTFSRERNNYFGHAAYDSNVGAANTYITPLYGIENHFGNYLNAGYIHETDWRNQGGSVGNKGVGVNVFYASDAYWGEKISQHYYRMDKLAGFKDYKEYTLGFFNSSNANIRKDASTNSDVVYSNRFLDAPIAIIENKTGSVSGNSTLWYGFTANPVLNNNKNQLSKKEIMIKDKESDIVKYNYNSITDKTVYVHSSLINIVSEGKNSKIKKQEKPTLPAHINVSKRAVKRTLPVNMNLRPDPSHNNDVITIVKAGTEVTTYRSDNGWYQVLVKAENNQMHLGYLNGEIFGIKQAGDVNNDGEVDAVDYVIISNYIMDRRVLNEQEKLRADVNDDGYIDAVDYIRIMNIIMGR